MWQHHLDTADSLKVRFHLFFSPLPLFSRSHLWHQQTGFLFMLKYFLRLWKALLCCHLHSCPSPGVISHSWHWARGTLKLIGRAWRGYECYDWRSPGEIEFSLVVMKKPDGEHGWDNVSMKLKRTGHKQSFLPIPRVHKRHHNQEEPDLKKYSGPGGESFFINPPVSSMKYQKINK